MDRGGQVLPAILYVVGRLLGYNTAMGEIADRLRGRKIVKVDDSDDKLRMTTDHGDFIMLPIDPRKPQVISSKIIERPATDAIH